MKIEMVSCNTLKPAKYNPRKMEQVELDKLKRSIDEFGFVEPIVVNKDNTIIGGHQRFYAVKDNGHSKVPCFRVNIPKNKEKILNLALNRIHGEWDDLKLAEVLDELIKDEDIDELLSGFDQDEIDALFETDEPKGGLTDPDSVPDDVEPICKLGDLWILGEHRLLCGDATSKDDIDRLMDGEAADLLLTDPPYGITSCEWDKEINLNELWKLLYSFSKKETVYIFTASQPFTSKLVMSNLKMFKHEWIWQKSWGSNFLTLKYAPMKEHESILVFNNSSPTFNPIKQQRSEQGLNRIKSIFKVKPGSKNSECYGNFKGKAETIRRSTLRHPSSIQKFKNETGKHPTQKPVSLMSYLIRTYSNVNDLILDPFLGSGTTLIAAEKLNRKCYATEIAPKYCDVAIKRWEDFIGNKAVKE